MFCTLFFSHLIRFHKVPHCWATNQHWPSPRRRKSRKDNRKDWRSISAWTGCDHWSDHSAAHKVPLLWCQVPSGQKVNVMWDLELEEVCLVLHWHFTATKYLQLLGWFSSWNQSDGGPSLQGPTSLIYCECRAFFLLQSLFMNTPPSMCLYCYNSGRNVRFSTYNLSWVACMNFLKMH